MCGQHRFWDGCAGSVFGSGLATREFVESGNSPCVTRGCMFGRAGESGKSWGRLGGAGNYRLGGRVTWPGSGCIGPREGASPKKNGGFDTVSDREQGKRADRSKILCVNYRLQEMCF